MQHLILVAVILVLSFLVWKSNFNAKGKKKLPPGLIRWPIIGSLPQMLWINIDYPHLQFHELSKKYGGILSIGVGPIYTVVLSSYDIMKEILRLPQANLERFKFQFSEQRNQGKNLGIIWAWGEFWEDQRKTTMKRLREIGFGKARSMEESVREEVNFLLEDIEKIIDGTGGVWQVDVNRLGAAVLNILWRYVDGVRFDPDDPKIKRHIRINQDMFEIMGMKNILSIFPFLQIFPNWSGYNRQVQCDIECREFMKEIIDDAKRRVQQGATPETFVEVTVDEIQKGKFGMEPSDAEEHLTFLLMDLFLGGADATSSVMSWLLLYIALKQDVQKTAREEMLKLSADGTTLVSLSATSRMLYIRACIFETMRHAEFCPLPMPRYLTEELEYGEFRLPKGSLLMYNLYSVFHDETFWGDPEEYRPERFIQPDTGELIQKKIERVAQFGIGKRSCPGESIGMDILTLFITMLLFRFSVEVVEGSEPTPKPESLKLTMNPRPYTVMLKRIY